MSDRSTPQFSTTPTRLLEPNIEYDTATLCIWLSEWARAKRDELPTRRFRNHRQLGIYLRRAINEEKLKKRASNGRKLYLLVSNGGAELRATAETLQAGYTGGV